MVHAEYVRYRSTLAERDHFRRESLRAGAEADRFRAELADAKKEIATLRGELALLKQPPPTPTKKSPPIPAKSAERGA